MLDKLGKEITIGQEICFVGKNSCGTFLDYDVVTDIKDDVVFIGKKTRKANEILVKDFEILLIKPADSVGKNVIWASNNGVEYGVIEETPRCANWIVRNKNNKRLHKLSLSLHCIK